MMKMYCSVTDLQGASKHPDHEHDHRQVVGEHVPPRLQDSERRLLLRELPEFHHRNHDACERTKCRIRTRKMKVDTRYFIVLQGNLPSTRSCCNTQHTCQRRSNAHTWSKRSYKHTWELLHSQLELRRFADRSRCSLLY